MLRGRKSASDKHSEKLIPIRVTITRKRGNFKYIYVIDGHRGEQTGEIYYKASEIKKIEHSLRSNSAIQSYMFNNIGLALNFETPQAIVYPESPPSGSVSGLSEIFNMQPNEKILFTQTITTGATS